jgi:hypothetical protein
MRAPWDLWPEPNPNAKRETGRQFFDAPTPWRGHFLAAARIGFLQWNWGTKLCTSAF